MNPSAMLTLATRYLGPGLLLLSVAVLYRGHNLPGGGFIGGLIAAAAFLLLALSRGWPAVESRLPVSSTTLMVLGLLIAFLSGLPGIVGGGPFMTGMWLPAFELPLLGKAKLGTPVLFDVGVYLTVIGFTLQCASALGKERS